MAEALTGAEALIKTLEMLGVEIVFGYPGGANLPLYDALRESDIRHILARHEQGASLMANGYGRLSDRPGVCLATSGPGATNIVTGLADCLLDSVPVVAITGQIPLKFLGTDAFQEVDTINLTMSVTKHNELVTDPLEIVPSLRSAWKIANSGRKGPVLLDFPKDVLLEKHFYDLNEERDLPGYNPTTEGHIGQIKKAIKLLAKAETPLIIIGGGVHTGNAEHEVREFAKLSGIPVVRTLMGKGIVDEEDEQFVGMIGTHGTTEGNKAISKADVIFAIGVRFGDRTTMQKKEKFAEKAKIIQLDIDPAEIGKVVPVALPIVGDIKLTLSVINKRLAKEPMMKNFWCAPKQRKNILLKNDASEVIEMVLQELSKIDTDLILTTDVGRHQMWATHTCLNPRHMPILTSGGLGTMGFGMPAAIGAWFVNRDKPVVNISGDGSFWMNNQEFLVAVEHNIPLTVVLINDSKLGMIKELQDAQYGKRHMAHDFTADIDYVKFAESLGGKGYKCHTADGITKTLNKAIHGGKPCIIDFDIYKIQDSIGASAKISAYA